MLNETLRSRADPKISIAGFSLIEVLVSLMIVGAIMAAIVPYSRDTLMRIAGMSERLPIARALSTLITERAQLRTTGSSFVEGKTGDIHWSVASRLAEGNNTNGAAETAWQPSLVTMTVTSPSGVQLGVQIIRLERP